MDDDRIVTNHPSSDPSMYPGISSLARPLAQSSSLHELSSKNRLKTFPIFWLPSGINAGIYMKEACTSSPLFNRLYACNLGHSQL